MSKAKIRIVFIFLLAVTALALLLSMLFVRKFDANVDMEVVQQIYDRLH